MDYFSLASMLTNHPLVYAWIPFYLVGVAVITKHMVGIEIKKTIQNLLRDHFDRYGEPVRGRVIQRKKVGRIHWRTIRYEHRGCCESKITRTHTFDHKSAFVLTEEPELMILPSHPWMAVDRDEFEELEWFGGTRISNVYGDKNLVSMTFWIILVLISVTSRLPFSAHLISSSLACAVVWRVVVMEYIGALARLAKRDIREHVYCASNSENERVELENFASEKDIAKQRKVYSTISCVSALVVFHSAVFLVILGLPICSLVLLGQSIMRKYRGCSILMRYGEQVSGTIIYRSTVHTPFCKMVFHSASGRYFKVKFFDNANVPMVDCIEIDEQLYCHFLDTKRNDQIEDGRLELIVSGENLQHMMAMRKHPVMSKSSPKMNLFGRVALSFFVCFVVGYNVKFGSMLATVILIDMSNVSYVDANFFLRVANAVYALVMIGTFVISISMAWMRFRPKLNAIKATPEPKINV